jgi:hypothetical protein
MSKFGKMLGLAVCLGCLLFSISFVQVASASEVEMLVQKLVEKGVLTQAEGAQLTAKAEHEARAKEIERGTLPSWVQNMNWGGDFRLRYESSRVKTDSSKSSRNRSRFRFRYGFTTDVNEQIKVGFRMASGSADPTSANQTFTGGFSSKNFWIDRAYMQYTFPNQNLTFFGGKFPNPFDRTGDLAWNGDIQPEGGALKLKMPTESVDYFANLAVMPLWEKSGTSSPFIFGAQLGAGMDVFGKPLKVSVAYYDFNHLKGNKEEDISPDYEPGTNSLDGDGKFVYDYRVINPSLEYTPLSLNILGQASALKLFGSYIHNTASDVSDDKGFLAGFSLGKAKNPGSWGLGYTYYRIEQDAIAAIINSSDFETNRRGHKVGVNYVLLENTTLGVNYFNMKNIKGSKRDQHKGQINLQVKF